MDDLKAWLSDPRFRRLALPLLALAWFAVLAVRVAWLCDDAYITFRTVDNFIHGYGLTWNVAERVQVYTNPLWMLLVSAVYFFTHEIYYTTLLLSIAVSLAAFAIYAFGLARPNLGVLVGAGVLTLSKAFMDYTSSGLENPLSYLLLAWFAYYYFHTREWSAGRLRTLSLLTALGGLNRLDLLLLFLPAWGYACWQTSRREKWWRLLGAVGAGFSPLAAWEIFSLFYYGFLFPNTAYAKLNTGVHTLLLVRFALNHLALSVSADPVTLLVIALAIGAAFLGRDRRTVPLALGVGLYLLYVLKIGGDFMLGRFLAVPFFLAVLVLTQNIVLSNRAAVFAGMLLFFTAAVSPFCPWLTRPTYDNQMAEAPTINDERGLYYQGSGFWLALQGNAMPRSGWDVHRDDPRKVVVVDGIGRHGYYAGPGLHIIDEVALGDPLLARLPAGPWRPGHFYRDLPAGYEDSIRSHSNQIVNPALHRYYGKLLNIIRGGLFSPGRWRDIVDMNLGRYDGWLQEYLHSRKKP